MIPILLDLPMPIYTNRLLIRNCQAGDGAAQLEAQLESRAELLPWMPWAQTEPTLQKCEEIMRRAHAQWILRDDLQLNIFDRVSGEFVGGTGLHRIKWDVPVVEIGYWIRTSRTGQGLVTESTAALTQYAFGVVGAQRVEVHCEPGNSRSEAVIRKLGFVHEGTLIENRRSADGTELRDTMIFARHTPAGLPTVGVSW